VSFWTDPTPVSQNPTPNVGELGEQLVAGWLKTQNWVILHHRWRCRWGEIDLIARPEERGREGEGENSLLNLETNRQLNPSRIISRFATSFSPLLAFVEVKTRSSGNWDADGRLAITPQKQTKLWQAAQLFLAEYPDLANFSCRFDVALVSCQRVSKGSRRVSKAASPLANRDASKSQEHCADSSSSPVEIDNTIEVSPIQLGQPILKSGYRLILQDYIQSAFDGVL